MVLMFKTARQPDRSDSRAVCGPRAIRCPGLMYDYCWWWFKPWYSLNIVFGETHKGRIYFLSYWESTEGCKYWWECHHKRTYSGALLYNCPALRRIRFMTIFLRSQLLPAVLRGGFLTIQAAKMAAVWRIFAGRWVFTPLERIERVSVRFNGVFNFALRCFRLTVIFLERIIIVKRGTTVRTHGQDIRFTNFSLRYS